MKDIKRLLNIIIFISCLFLVTSYFLPVEASWSPQQAWCGYYDPGGEFVAGFNVGLIEIFPYAVGAMILLTLALLQWPKICIVKLAIFSTIWIISLAYEVNRIVGNISYKFPKLWLILPVLLVPSVVVVVILALRKSRKKTAVLTFAAILAVSSILYQACSIAWYLLEDSLLLNIGAVTGVAAAAVLLVALMTQRQISKSIKEQT